MRPAIAAWSLGLELVASAQIAAAGRGDEGVHRMAVASMEGNTRPCLLVGEPPGKAHPRGTMIVLDTLHDGSFVEVWDLATYAKTRSLPLPASAFQGSASMVRAGDQIHIAITSYSGRLSYLRLAPDLNIEAVESLGDSESAKIATDGNIVAVLSFVPESPSSIRSPVRPRVFVMDARGRSIGTSALGAPCTTIDRSPLVVLGGKIFILTGDYDPTLTELGPDGRVDAQRRMGHTDHTIQEIWGAGDHLVYVDDCEAQELRAGDLRQTDRLRFPYPAGLYGCVDLALTPDASGRFVASTGDVLSPKLRVERHFWPGAHGQVLADATFWLGRSPALLLMNVEAGRFDVLWADPQ